MQWNEWELNPKRPVKVAPVTPRTWIELLQIDGASTHVYSYATQL